MPWTLLSLMTVAAPAEPLSINNGLLTVTCHAAEGTFDLAAGGHVFVSGAALTAPAGAARVVEFELGPLGRGQAIEVTRPDGRRDRVALLPGVPFALLSSVLANRGQQDAVVVHHEPGALPLTPGAGLKAGLVAGLRALGTAGLTEPDKHPGSYVFLALADPASNAGVVGGWLTHDRGDGVVFSSREGQTIVMTPRLDYGNLRLHPGGSAATEVFAVGAFADARLGLEQLGDLIGRYYQIKLPPAPSGYCTWYSNPHGGAADEQSLAKLTDVAAEQLKPYGFDFVQIDDGWQLGQSHNGPNKVFEDHRPGGSYASGMKAAADHIRARGLTAGIWFMPFAGNFDDPFFAAHPEWLVKRADGQPFDTPWGGTSLDMTEPGARARLAAIAAKMSHQWGYKYFKMDGLYTGAAVRQVYVNHGYVDDHLGEAVFHDPDKTNIEAYRDGLKLVRQAAGPDVFFLGCCASQNMRSFGGAFGLVDAMRVGPDNGADWDGIKRGPFAASNRWWLHGRVWYNDPDPVYIRPSTPIEQARLICSWAGIAGCLTAFSEWLPEMPPERVELLKRIFPNHGHLARPVDVFEHSTPNVWVVSDAQRTVVGLYNWEQDQPARFELPLAKLGLPAGAYAAFDFWGNHFLPVVSDQLSVSVPPTACRVIALRAMTGAPTVVSTSRHVSQGMVELSGEHWDPATRTLSGLSRLVAGDRYELRVAVPVGADSFHAVAAKVAGDPTVELRQSGPMVRLAFTSAGGGPTAWSLSFEPAAVRAAPPAAPSGLTALPVGFGLRLSWDGAEVVGWRLTRPDGSSVDCSEPTLHETRVPPNQPLHYRLAALGWDGTASPPADLDVPPLAVPPLPASLPTPDIWLDSLTPKEATVGWGQLQTNKSIAGHPLTLAGKVYAHGLGAHAVSHLLYDVPAGAKRFVATVGIDDEERGDPRASVEFQVWGLPAGGQAKMLATTPILCDQTTRVWALDVPLDGPYQQLRLVVTDAGDGIAADHGDWCQAGFVK
jgi:hypothetical protein